MSNFLETLQNRRSIYALGRNVELTETEIEELVKNVVEASPTAFHAQGTRAVILFGDAHEKLWSLTQDALEPLTPAEAFEGTKQKLAGFKAGYGTVLFFSDLDTVKNLQEQFPLYADSFPGYAEQEHGIAAANTWTAFAEAGLGGNLQHYNPVIDEAVAAEWNIPANWKLRSQLVFGSKEGDAGEKEHLAADVRFRVYK
ncbi:nitroreductase family protein [Enterococcus saccharolyticus]|uniref:Nitroreductase n=1 Tax=Candidatus Enterococcus willemsii TaxID=1857215 RepID=A0ABQ6YXZ9_9ENTE|nr:MULTISPECIES: nitroreductase family protein [Enterococcus]KAF1302908.1 nitroreductase [Enterococcus sp. CU12B]MCD5000942.1 nitroreductase family protein [Enterococcus saccharolyticus]